MFSEMKKIVYTLMMKQQYLKWRLFHPFSPFSEFYLKTVFQKLDTGVPHGSLGNKYKDNTLFHKSGKVELEFLFGQGLQPTHKCIDYGCGSLRVGRHLIDFLERDNYFGVDITDRFYKEGLETLDKRLIESKKPTFHLLSPSQIDKLKNIGADFIISTEVLIHIPINNLDEFLETIIQIMKKDAKAFISFRESEEYIQAATARWSYPSVLLKKKVQQLGAKAEILSNPEIAPIVGVADWKIIKISKSDISD